MLLGETPNRSIYSLYIYVQRVWNYEVDGAKLILSYTDADGSEGLPGEVTTKVTYTLDAHNTLTMGYVATTTKPTVVDMGSHFMVNLGGHVSAGSNSFKIKPFVYILDME